MLRKLSFFTQDHNQPNEELPLLADTQQVVPMSSILKSSLLQTLPEAAVAIVAAGISEHFAENDMLWIYHPAVCSAIYVVANFANRLIDNKFFQTNTKVLDDVIQYALKNTRSATFALMTSTTVADLVHESGHAFADMVLYRDSHPQVVLKSGFFTRAAYTTFDSNQLSDIGHKLGQKNSEAIVYAAGTAVNILFYSLVSVFAHALPERFNEAKYSLQMAALYDVIVHFSYAISAYFVDDKTNDFIELDKRGVPPAAAAAVIAGYYLLLQLMVFGIKKCCSTKENDARRVDELSDDNTNQVRVRLN